MAAAVAIAAAGEGRAGREAARRRSPPPPPPPPPPAAGSLAETCAEGAPDPGGADWAPIVFDAFRRDCASHALLKILANRWAVLVVSALAMGRQRHSVLARKVEGATPKMLTQALRRLERDGLVTRRVTPSAPPRVDYALTPLGRELASVLRGLCRWSETRAARILVARARAENAPLTETTWRRLAGLE
ncbi:helix-turn-helix domain-containing protein [uncultured Albimonas sp.]|uniref:winged helix-turn-helix transcriptional regulator n=1 Tax=uncultured Albimonas sp. TaxID=1331701 RepID=UPI0030ED3A25